VQLSSLLILIICVVSIICMLVRPRGIKEAYWACGGALLLVATRLLPVRQAGQAVYKGVDVYLFLTGMMILAEMAREEGVFDWIADVAGHRAQGSSKRLFLLVYLAGTVVTALLSNDATAVVLTPAVLAVVRKAKINPKPHLLACAFIANAASFVLPISNPANLVIFAKHMPPLMRWLGIFTLPSIAAVVVTFIVLRWMLRSELEGLIQDLKVPVELTTEGKLALSGLVLAGVALIAASAMGLDLGAPTCGAALVALLIVAWRDRGVVKHVATGVSWVVIPLVAGLFIMVQALEVAGVLRLVVTGLERVACLPATLGNLVAAFNVGVISNVMNNLPVGLLSSAAIPAAQPSGSLVNAVLIGVDLGPNLSVTGSLATILWLIALRREKVEITAWQFLAIGVVAMPLALLSSVLLLRK
jgi:arsenical pump membrane protein